MSIMEAYRQFQREQAARGIDPSKNARLTQEEQADLRQDRGLTPVSPSNNPLSNSAPAPAPVVSNPAPAPVVSNSQPQPIISQATGLEIDPSTALGQATLRGMELTESLGTSIHSS